jgi:hypothetical protein
MMPTAAIAHLMGARGEAPGEHAHFAGDKWAAFKNDIAARGIEHQIFITVDHGEEPKNSERNNRRDAAVELGIPMCPWRYRYFGHAERAGSVLERWQRQQEREAV